MESLLRVELGTNSARPLGAAAGGGCISAGQSYETGPPPLLSLSEQSHCCLFVQPRWLRSLQPRRCSLGWSPLADGANPLSERVWRSRHSSQPSPCVASP
ncbi:unnamed protein product [Lampetra planeri]